jgi:hypothetical protein
MVSKYPENSTDAMLKAINGFNTLRTTILGHLRHQLSEARAAANVVLPATNERGKPVVHGCRKEVSGLVEFYETQIKNFLTIDGNDRLIEYGGMALPTDGHWAM